MGRGRLPANNESFSIRKMLWKGLRYHCQHCTEVLLLVNLNVNCFANTLDIMNRAEASPFNRWPKSVVCPAEDSEIEVSFSIGWKLDRNSLCHVVPMRNLLPYHVYGLSKFLSRVSDSSLGGWAPPTTSSTVGNAHPALSTRDALGESSPRRCASPLNTWLSGLYHLHRMDSVRLKMPPNAHTIRRSDR